jgi:3-hydroxybutyryl-CoA dehydrogenase
MMSTPSASQDITRVGVIGGGLMGSGIAEVCARNGADVVVTELNATYAAAAGKRIDGSLARAVKSGKMTNDDADLTRKRIQVVIGIEDQADRDLVIEAATEDEGLKLKVFAELDHVVSGPSAILASNTSSIPIAKLAAATARPESVIGIHFFNPAPVQQLVEVIPSLLTAEGTVQRVVDFITGVVGKQVVQAKDRAGFVVNALLVPFMLSAIRMLEAGLATAEDIDKGMVLGCSHPMGPLRLADLAGLDTAKAAAESMYREYGEPQYAPPALLSRMVESGLLGRKSGRGFYVYG